MLVIILRNIISRNVLIPFHSESNSPFYQSLSHILMKGGEIHELYQMR